MSLATWLGAGDIGEKSVEEARVAINEAVDKLSPLFRDVENRAALILHGLLDRVEVNIQISIKPSEDKYPKATEVK